MAKMDATNVAQKWKQRISASVQAVKDGVNAVTESPMEKAASRADAYAAGVQRAVEEGRYQEGLRSVSLANWKRLTAEKGATRIAQGAAEAESTMRDFFAQLLPVTAQVSQEVSQMPKGTLEDSIARSEAAIRKMSQFRFRKRASS